MTREALIGRVPAGWVGTSLFAWPRCAPTPPHDAPPPGFGRLAHIHFEAAAPGRRPLTTQLRSKGGQSTVTFDFVLAKE